MSDASALPTCVAKNRHSGPCIRDALPSAPVALCLEHAAEILHFLNERLVAEQPALAAVRSIERADRNVPTLPQRHVAPTGKGVAVIYYIRIGDHIKVGFSRNLAQRMLAYPPDAELLAYEHGDWALEKKRHAQFRQHLRLNNEWFTPSVDLLAHIERVRGAMAA